MGIAKIKKMGRIPYHWYGLCTYCNTILSYERDTHELPPIEGDLKHHCLLCKETEVTFYRSDTPIGRSLKRSIQLAAESENKT
jgi:hypothetical protein